MPSYGPTSNVQKCLFFPKFNQHSELFTFWLFVHLPGKNDQFNVVIICIPCDMNEIIPLFHTFKTNLCFLFGELAIHILYLFIIIFLFVERCFIF